MIEMRRRQLSFGDGLIAEEVSDLREDWMKHADAVLADSLRPCTAHWRDDIARAVVVGVVAHRLTWCCDY